MNDVTVSAEPWQAEHREADEVSFACLCLSHLCLSE
jgi:hypothetical protein